MAVDDEDLERINKRLRDIESDRIGAVRRYRELTGSSLGEANEAVSAITP